jgi:hypothetical protein
MAMLEQALRSSVFHLVAERRRLEEELMDMEKRVASTASIEDAERRKRTTMTTNTDLTAERDKIDAQMAALSRQTPERAKQLVAEADRLMAKRDDEFAELRAKRDAIDEAFRISAQQEADARRRERREARQAAVTHILGLNEGILNACETAEAHLRDCVEAMRQAMDAAKEAQSLTKELSGGAWSAFEAQSLTNFFSAEFSRTFREAWGKPTFGLHCQFREPAQPIRGGRYLANWRERCERETAAAVERVMGEL